MHSNVYPKCAICHQPPNNGLFDGFRLAGKFICSACQKEVMLTSAGSDSYDQMLNAIRNVLFFNGHCRISEYPLIKYIR